MTTSTDHTSAATSDGTEGRTTSLTDLGQHMWSFLTGKKATIDYTFIDMTVEVPRETGPASPRATWKLNGTLRIATADHEGGAVDVTRA